MTESDKKKIIEDYFDTNIFEPALNWARENRKMNVFHGVMMTRVRMFRLPPRKMIQFFWNAIVGTEHSIAFSDIMKRNNITRFEDVMEDVRIRFDDKFLNS